MLRVTMFYVILLPMKKTSLIVLLAIPIGTPVLQGCSSQQQGSPPTASSTGREEHEKQGAQILADIHGADPAYKMAEKAMVNKRGQLVLKVNRQATEAEVKPMATVALKRLVQSFPGPKAAVMVVGPSGQRIATARLGANNEVVFFDPRQPAG